MEIVIFFLITLLQAMFLRGCEDLKNVVNNCEVVEVRQLVTDVLVEELSTLIDPEVKNGKHKQQTMFDVSSNNGVKIEITLRMSSHICGSQLNVIKGGQSVQATMENLNFCLYQGTTNHKEKVTADTNGGLNALIWTERGVYVITPSPTSEQPLRHIYFNVNDVSNLPQYSCGLDGSMKMFDDITKTIRANNEDARSWDRKKRDVRSAKKYIEMHFVAASDMLTRFGSEEVILQRLLSYVNIMDSFYATFDIRAVLVGVDYWIPENEVFLNSSDLIATLFNLLDHKQQKFESERSSLFRIADHTTYITTDFLSDSGLVLGVAPVEGMCSPISWSYVFVLEIPFLNFDLTWLTLTHELGHSLGLQHPDDLNVQPVPCSCGSTRNCIMSTALDISNLNFDWSNCSIQQLPVQLELSTGYCLLNKPDVFVPSVSVCGNRRLEQGEECDCGTPSTCSSICCNPHTCKLYEGAQCGNGACCDLDICKFKPAGVSCRSLCDPWCDLPEYCLGDSAKCPDDDVIEDGYICRNASGRCRDGYCRTRDDHCEAIFGSGAMNGPDVCQERNTFGTIDGNCGLNTTINGISLAVDIIPCELADKDCGKVICSNMSDTRGLPTYFIVTLDGGEECVTKVPLIFPGVFRDSTYVENNIGCEDNSKVCFEGRCVDFNSLCPNDCHGNGVCTSRGECFCNPGFSPPNCTSPGFGGSISSGPVPSTDPVCTHESPRDKFGITTEEVKVEVDCRYTCISVSFNICPFIQRGYNLSNLVLFGPALVYNPLQQQLPEVNNSCRIQLDPFVFGHDPRGRITLQFGGGNLMSGACGSVIINEPSSISFVHRLRTIEGVSLAGGGRVVRTRRNFVFDFTCNFSTEVQSVGGIAPSENILTKTREQEGRYTVEMTLYRDEGYNKVISPGDVISVNQRVFVAVELQRVFPSLWIQAKTCWASDNMTISTGGLEYEIIKDFCAAPDPLGSECTNNITENCESQRARFSFAMFKWVTSSRDMMDIYIHCESKVCDSSAQQCQCGNCSESRKRRSNNDRSNLPIHDVISAGPFVVT